MGDRIRWETRIGVGKPLGVETRRGMGKAGLVGMSILSRAYRLKEASKPDQ